VGSPPTGLSPCHHSAGVSATGLTAATPSRPAPSTVAPSHPRLKPTPDVGSVSVDAIRLAISKATAPAARRARLARFLWGPLSPVSPSNLLIEREEPLTRGTHLPDPVNALCASEAAPSSYPKLDRVPPSLALGFAQGIDRRGEAVGIDLGHVACAAGWNATHSSGLLVNTRLPRILAGTI